MSELLSSLLGDPENAEKLGRIAAVLGAMTGEEEGCGDSCAPQEGRRGERHDRQGCGDGQCGGACATRAATRVGLTCRGLTRRPCFLRPCPF